MDTNRYLCPLLLNSARRRRQAVNFFIQTNQPRIKLGSGRIDSVNGAINFVDSLAYVSKARFEVIRTR